MSDFRAFFKGRRITLVGLGLLGRGIGDVRFLAECGADLIVTDLKSEEQLKTSLEELREFPNIRYTLGCHDLADFRDRDLIINGPAVPLDSVFIAEARKNNIPITMSTALFARFAREAGATVVGITGTRGKTTTTELIYEVLQKSGRKVLLGGNIKGVSTLALLPRVDVEVVAVLELDSWQLQGFREERLSPDIAVFTTLYPDHLNYYAGDMDAYLADKAEIFLHQRPTDTLVLGEQVEGIVQTKYEERIPSHAVVAYAADVPDTWRLNILGLHNRENAACALFALRLLQVPEEEIQHGFESFKGVPGRLELVREVHGVRIYNDTTATTPEATIAGLQALDPENKQNILLIMGGADKHLDMKNLALETRRHCKKVLLLAGTGTERIIGEFSGSMVYDSMNSAVSAAQGAAQEGDVILMSPAFASFGMFKNEYDRGEQFVAAVNDLK